MFTEVGGDLFLKDGGVQKFGTLPENFIQGGSGISA